MLQRRNGMTEPKRRLLYRSQTQRIRAQLGTDDHADLIFGLPVLAMISKCFDEKSLLQNLE